MPTQSENIESIPGDVVLESMWFEVKKIRSRLLAETDFTQISDTPLTAEKKLEFSVYRQELRDLPEGFASPVDVVWPVKPEFI